MGSERERACLLGDCWVRSDRQCLLTIGRQKGSRAPRLWRRDWVSGKSLVTERNELHEKGVSSGQEPVGKLENGWRDVLGALGELCSWGFSIIENKKTI